MNRESSPEQLDTEEVSADWNEELAKLEVLPDTDEVEQEGQEPDGAEPDEEISEPDEQSESPDDWKSKEYDVNGEKLSGAELASGYMKDADYRQKTAQVAQLRREFEQKTQHVSGELDKRANTLDVLANALYREIVGDQNQLSELVNTDPAEYLRRSHHIAERNKLLQAASIELEQVKKAQAQLSEQQVAEYAQNEYQKLVEVLPEWRDQNTANAEGAEIAKYLMSSGYEQSEVSELLDHRALVIARKAMLYDKRAALKPVATATAQPIKPGSPNHNVKDKTREQLRAKAIKSQSRDDFANALSAYF